jgi:hypothetical protein
MAVLAHRLMGFNASIEMRIGKDPVFDGYSKILSPAWNSLVKDPSRQFPGGP